MTPDTLRALIDASGLSIREWARTVAGRDPRTVTRWLAGDPIPAAAQEWLARVVRVETTGNRVTVVLRRYDQMTREQWRQEWRRSRVERQPVYPATGDAPPP